MIVNAGIAQEYSIWQISEQGVASFKGGGGWQQIAEFEVGEPSSPMVNGQERFTSEYLLSINTNVRVYVSGIALPNFELSSGGRYVSYTAGNNYLDIVGGVNDLEYVTIDKY